MVTESSADQELATRSDGFSEFGRESWQIGRFDGIGSSPYPGKVIHLHIMHPGQPMSEYLLLVRGTLARLLSAILTFALCVGCNVEGNSSGPESESTSISN